MRAELSPADRARDTARRGARRSIWNCTRRWRWASTSTIAFATLANPPSGSPPKPPPLPADQSVPFSATPSAARASSKPPWPRCAACRHPLCIRIVVRDCREASMRFVHVRCSICGLPFTVVQSDGSRSAQVDHLTWRRWCRCGSEVTEPRLCGNLRAAVFTIGADDENDRRPDSTQKPSRARRAGPGRGHKGPMRDPGGGNDPGD